MGVSGIRVPFCSATDITFDIVVQIAGIMAM